jgi:hypothetical protein
VKETDISGIQQKYPPVTIIFNADQPRYDKYDEYSEKSIERGPSAHCSKVLCKAQA